MGFINQFPYSDFHELNLDWLIKRTKALESTMAEIEEEFSKIKILTEEYIQAMINTAIAENNIELYNQMNILKQQITSDYTSMINDKYNQLKIYTDNQIDAARIYTDSQDAYYFGLSKNYSDANLVEAKAYIDGKVLDYTLMISPFSGQLEDVRDVVNEIIYYFHSNNTLTAAEYDALDLTAQAYDNYELTAYDYDFNGKNLLV